MSEWRSAAVEAEAYWDEADPAGSGTLAALLHRAMAHGYRAAGRGCSEWSDVGEAMADDIEAGEEP